MRRGFTVHHNGPAVYTSSTAHTRCEAFWRAVRAYHINTKGWSDIAYSFGVCRHGTRFEGRGWDKSQWANGSDVVGEDDGPDSEWYTVLVFLGGDEQPTAEMYQGVTDLISEGRSSGRCGLRILPHNAFKVKACPGPEFTAYARQHDNLPFPEDDMFEQADRDTLNNIYQGLYRRDYDGDGTLDTPFVADGVNGILDRVIDLQAAVGALQAQVGGIQATGGSVDLDALAEAVADKLAARLAN